jgi:predicted lipoprotein with Yx(FWY)xxD motif
MRKLLASAALLAALTVAVAACGDSSKQASGATATPAPTTAAAQREAGGTVAVATTGLGAVLVDAKGRTLYAFTKDKGSQSVCTGQCAATWPALAVQAAPTAGTGVQASLLSTSRQANGATQVTYGGKPLYYFAGDAKPGDTKGQGLNSVWFVVRADGSLVRSNGYG